MKIDPRKSRDSAQMGELRLFLEDVCCDLCRFIHVDRDRLAPEQVKIDREVFLGAPGAYADIRVIAAGHPPYFVEVKYGHSIESMLRSLRRKYGHIVGKKNRNIHVILVIDSEMDEALGEIETLLHGWESIRFEIWDESRMVSMLRQQFGVEMGAINETSLLDLRVALDYGKGVHAFGEAAAQGFRDSSLRSMLLWHFGFWRLRQLREARNLSPREILPPGVYPKVAVLLADLCSFSSFVRDTRDPEIVRQCLTAFYSKSRYQIIHAGGMLYQFVGDQVVALFGIPDHQANYIAAALEAAKRLIDIGNSISHHWQRYIDRLQCSGGVHVGIAVGELQIVSYRPFSRAHLGAVGDTINLGARLMQSAESSEIVVSNAFFNELEEEEQLQFTESQTVEAKNVGSIKAWKLASTGVS